MIRRLSSALAVLAVILLPVLALAQEVADIPAAAGVPWLTIAVAGVGALVMVGGFFGFWTWLRGKLGELGDLAAEKTGISLLAHVDEILVGYAVDLYNSEIKAAKEAAEDGKLTPEESARFLQILVNRTKAHFGLGRLAGLVSTGEPGDVELALRSRAEVAVLEAKARGAAAKAVKVDPSLASPQG